MAKKKNAGPSEGKGKKKEKKKRPKMKGEGRVYKYGVVGRGPTENLEGVYEQFRLAHRYRNKLCEIELNRRAQVDTALAVMSPELHALEQEIGRPARDADPESGTPPMPATGLLAQIEGAERAARRRRVAARSRLPDPQRAQLRVLRDQLRELRGRRRELRTELFASPGWIAEQERIEGEVNAATRQARSACGLYWGTYLQVEAAATSMRRGAPPRYRPWSKRRDKLAVQIQKGLSPDEVLACQDNRLRLAVSQRPHAQPGSRRGREKLNGVVSLRIGSDGRKPVWAKIPIRYHRPLPAHARVKWVYLIRRARGSHSVWSVQFVLEAESWQRDDTAVTGSVGIDVGWRRFDDRLRVAVWAGSDGQEGELALPNRWLSQQDRVERIRSERDRLFDEIRPALVERWPDERAWLSRTRSTGRAAALIVRERRDGESIPPLVEAWRQRERHLHDFEDHLRAQLQDSREDLYRCFAARMSRSYAELRVEALDLREFHVLPNVEEGETHQQDAMRSYVRDACLSALLDALGNRARAVTRLDPAATTTRCHACGHNDAGWTDHADLYHTCPNCGLCWDQDVNAARNLLAGENASGPVVAWERPPVAPDEVMTFAPVTENRAERRARERRELEMERVVPEAVAG